MDDYGTLPGGVSPAMDGAEFFDASELHPVSSQRILCLKAMGAHMFDPTTDEVEAVKNSLTYPYASTDAALLLWVLSQPGATDESGKRQETPLRRAQRFSQWAFEEAIEWADAKGILPGGANHDEAMKIFSKTFLDYWADGYEDAEEKKPEGGETGEVPGKQQTGSQVTKSAPPKCLGKPLITSGGTYRSGAGLNTFGPTPSGKGSKSCAQGTANGG